MNQQLAKLIALANQLNEEFAGCRRRSLILSKELGDALLAIKKIVGRTFTAWRAEHFTGSSSTAERCQRIAIEWDRKEFVAERQRDSNMDFTTAFQFLAKLRKKNKRNTTVQRLLATLESLKPAVTLRDIIKQSSCFVFKHGMIHAFNDEVAFSAPSPLGESGEAFEGAVPALPLLTLLQRLSDEDITLSVEGSQLMVRGKRKQAGLQWDRRISLPIDEIAVPTDWLPLPENFAEAIHAVQQCVDKDQSNYAGSSIHIHPDYLEACDNSQAIRYRIAMPIQKPFLVRGESIKHIEGLDMTEFSLTEQEGEDGPKYWLHFRNANGVTLACRRDLQEYESLENIFSLTGRSLILPNEIGKALRTAETFSSENPDENEVYIELSAGRLRILSDGITGWYAETFDLPTYQGRDVEFQIGPRIFAALAKQYPDCEIQVTDSTLKIETDKFVFSAAFGKPKRKKAIVIRPKRPKRKQSTL